MQKKKGKRKGEKLTFSQTEKVKEEDDDEDDRDD